MPSQIGIGNSFVDFTGVGSIAWTNKNEISSSNNTYATNTTEAPYGLDVTDMGLSIPSNGIIYEVGVSAECKLSSGSIGFAIQLIWSGGAGGSADLVVDDVEQARNGSINFSLPTVSQANSSAFGYRLTLGTEAAPYRTASFDYVTLTVYYAIPRSYGFVSG